METWINTLCGLNRHLLTTKRGASCGLLMNSRPISLLAG
jgi:hypothetical protein